MSVDGPEEAWGDRLGAPEGEAAVVACDYVNIELPPCGGGVAGDQVAWLPPDLYAHMDAVERDAVSIAEPPTRKLEPFDSDAHLAKPSTSGPESTRPFRLSYNAG